MANYCMLGKEGSISIPAHTIACQHWGDDTSSFKILALHGFLDSSATWDLALPHFLDEFKNRTGSHPHVVAIDFPGHGRSSSLPPSGVRGAVVMSMEVIEVVHALGWPTFHIIAHSLGAAVALTVAGLLAIISNKRKPLRPPNYIPQSIPTPSPPVLESVFAIDCIGPKLPLSDEEAVRRYAYAAYARLFDINLPADRAVLPRMDALLDRMRDRSTFYATLDDAALSTLASRGAQRVATRRVGRDGLSKPVSGFSFAHDRANLAIAPFALTQHMYELMCCYITTPLCFIVAVPGVAPTEEAFVETVWPAWRARYLATSSPRRALLASRVAHHAQLAEPAAIATAAAVFMTGAVGNDDAWAATQRWLNTDVSASIHDAALTQRLMTMDTGRKFDAKL